MCRSYGAWRTRGIGGLIARQARKSRGSQNRDPRYGCFSIAAADCVVAGGGNWVCLVHRFGEFGCVGSFGGEAAAGAGKAADLKTEIRATGLRKPWACKLFI